MSRSEKLRKLGNAIRAYRGISSSPSGAVKIDWEIPPQPKKRFDIVNRLTELQLPIAAAMNRIEGFRSVLEFQEWMKKVAANEWPEKPKVL